jgi:hypothetical protein
MSTLGYYPYLVLGAAVVRAFLDLVALCAVPSVSFAGCSAWTVVAHSTYLLRGSAAALGTRRWRFLRTRGPCGEEHEADGGLAQKTQLRANTSKEHATQHRAHSIQHATIHSTHIRQCSCVMPFQSCSPHSQAYYFLRKKPSSADLPRAPIAKTADEIDAAIERVAANAVAWTKVSYAEKLAILQVCVAMC